MSNGWRIFGAESAFFAPLLFLAWLTPATPNLVEFFGEKRRELVIGYLWLQETILRKILVDFGSLRPSEAIGWSQ
jgi:hypothetical protein